MRSARAGLAAAVVVLALTSCTPAPPVAGLVTPSPFTRATATPTRLAATPVRQVLPTLAPRRAQPTLVPTAIAMPAAAIAVPAARLDGVLAAALPDPAAEYGLVIEEVATGAHVAVNDRRVFPSASLYKLAVAWEVLRHADQGSLDLEASLPITDEDAVEPEPYGGVAPGEEPTLHEALTAMLTISSNAAAHAFLRVLGRHDFNAAMDQLGLGDTRVPEGADDDAQAVTSAADMARLALLIAHNQMLSGVAHDDLVQLMASGGPPDALRETLPETIDVYDKTGNLPDASNVTALLQSARGMVVLVVLDQGVDPGDARGVIAQLGQAAYEAVLR